MTLEQEIKTLTNQVGQLANHIEAVTSQVGACSNAISGQEQRLRELAVRVEVNVVAEPLFAIGTRAAGLAEQVATAATRLRELGAEAVASVGRVQSQVESVAQALDEEHGVAQQMIDDVRDNASGAVAGVLEELDAKVEQVIADTVRAWEEECLGALGDDVGGLLKRFEELHERGQALTGSALDSLGDVVKRLHAVADALRALKPAFDVINQVA